MKRNEFIDEVIRLFGDKTGCNIQHKGCPCNSCFHAIAGVDFRHICWILLLEMRGDYKDTRLELVKLIKEELEK